MTVVSHASTPGLGPSPAYRRFLSDMRRQVIPAPLLRYPELAELEQQRRRLVQALEDAEQSGPSVQREEVYIAQRAKALRAGTPLPPAPPTPAEVEAGQQQRARDVQAATDALLALGDDICRTIAAHPEWQAEAQAQVQALHDEAADALRRAQAAERQAQVAQVYVQWLDRAAFDELYVVTLP